MVLLIIIGLTLLTNFGTNLRMIFATIEGGLLLVFYCQESLRVSHHRLFSMNFFLSLLKQNLCCLS